MHNQNRFPQIVTDIVLIIFGLIVLFNFLSSLFITYNFYETGKLTRVSDSLLINLLFLVLTCTVCIILQKKSPQFFLKLHLKKVKLLAFVSIIVAGGIWVAAVDCAAYADSASILNGATAFAQGDYSMISGHYFNAFPFQLGYAFILETIERVIGYDKYIVLGLINVVALACSYLALYKITDLLFENKNASIFAIILSLLFLPPVFFCSFIYGNMLALCFSAWGCFFEIKYLKTGKTLFACVMILFLSFGVLAKLNAWIVVIASTGILFIDCLRKFKLLKFVIIVLVLLMPIALTSAVTSRYEGKANSEISNGIPQSVWLAMGLHDYSIGPGRYDGYNYNVWAQSGYNTKTANKIALHDVKLSLIKFSQDPKYAIDFFARKANSQWNDPEFQSIALNIPNSISSPPWIYAVHGNLRNSFFAYFNQYLQFKYCMAVVGFFGLLAFRKKKADILPALLLPVAITGGFFYHLLFEAQSHYIIPYVIMLIPIAAFGISMMPDFFSTVKSFVHRRG